MSWQEHYQLEEQAPFTIEGVTVFQACAMKKVDIKFKTGDIIEINEKEFGLFCFLNKEDKLLVKYFDLDIKEGTFHECEIISIVKGNGCFEKNDMVGVFKRACEVFKIESEQSPAKEHQPPMKEKESVLPPTKKKEKEPVPPSENKRPKRECVGKKKVDEIYEQEPPSKKTKTQKKEVKNKTTKCTKTSSTTTTTNPQSDEMKKMLELLQSQQTIILQLQQQQQQDKQELVAMIKEAEKSKPPTQSIQPMLPPEHTPTNENKFPSTVIFQIYQDPSRNQSRWGFSQPMFDLAPMFSGLPWPTHPPPRLIPTFQK